jgi:hypothetical protein
MLYADKNKLDDNPHLGKKKNEILERPKFMPGILVHAFNPRTWKAEAGESGGYVAWLHSKPVIGGREGERRRMNERERERNPNPQGIRHSDQLSTCSVWSIET